MKGESENNIFSHFLHSLFNFNFGSSILLRLSLLSLSGNASFESGMAALGGAINALDRSHVSLILKFSYSAKKY